MKMKDKITFFANGSSNVKPSKIITLAQLFQNMTSNVKAEKTFETLRLMKDTNIEEYKKLKMKLPYVALSGVFSYRNNDGLDKSTYTWLCPIDIDAKDNPNVDMKYIFYQLCAFESTLFCAKSPSGKGLKAIIRLKTNGYKIDDHYLVMKNVIYKKIEKHLGCVLDYSQGKLSQPFFLTYDPDAYINMEAIELETDYTFEKRTINNLSEDLSELSENADKKDYLIDIYCDKLLKLTDNKYVNCGNVAFTLGGWYRAGHFTMSKDDIINKMLKSVDDNNNILDKKQKHNFIKISFKNGYEKPIQIISYDTEILKTFDYANASLDEIKKYKNSLAKAPVNSVLKNTTSKFSFRNKYDVRDYLFYPILKEKQLGIIFGNTGDGKSIFALDMANQIAKGKSDWQGFRVDTEPQNVLYIDFELGGASLKERYTIHKFDPKLNIQNVNNFEFNSMIGFDNKLNDRLDRAIEWIIALAKEHDSKVVFVDNLSNIADNTEKAADADRFISDLYARKKSTDLTIFFIGHIPKVPINAPLQVNQLKGSSSLAKTFETMVGFKRSLIDRNLSYLKQLKCRDVEEVLHDENVATFNFENNKVSGFTLNFNNYAVEDVLLTKITDNRKSNGGKVKYEEIVKYEVIEDMLINKMSYTEIINKYSISKGTIARYKSEYDNVNSEFRDNFEQYLKTKNNDIFEI